DRVGPAEDLLLDTGVLDHGLDHQVRGYDIADGLHAREDIVGIGAALLREPAEALPHRLEAALDGARRRIVQHYAPARRGDDLCDAAAHLARADDQHVLEPHAASLVPGARPHTRCASRASRPRFTVQPTPNVVGVRIRE